MMSVDPFWSTVAGSLWLRHLRSELVAAMCIVLMVDTEGASVLVHCSDGWDRTSQLCAVGQVLLDPYFRSIRGLCCLIEKEWASFGHKFRERFVTRMYSPNFRIFDFESKLVCILMHFKVNKL